MYLERKTTSTQQWENIKVEKSCTRLTALPTPGTPTACSNLCFSAEPLVPSGSDKRFRTSFPAIQDSLLQPQSAWKVTGLPQIPHTGSVLQALLHSPPQTYAVGRRLMLPHFALEETCARLSTYKCTPRFWDLKHLQFWSFGTSVIFTMFWTFRAQLQV